MTDLSTAWLALRHFGPSWAGFRLRYAWERRTGALVRRSPCCAWNDIPATAALPAWLRAPRLPDAAKGWGTRCVDEAAGIARGEFVLFSNQRKALGFPPVWSRNAFTGQVAPRGRHWSALDDFTFGDIKAIWELSRFGWAFALARAHARDGAAAHAETFWKLFEDWGARNPPNAGVNWMCGQEATFRLMAVTFAVAEFSQDASSTSARLELWSRFVIATGRRIAANLPYALSQSNNHGVSECAGLVTAGLLAGDSTEARGWIERGLRELHAQLDELVYADGGFSQHSFNYHRVLLHDLFWTIAILRAAGHAVPDWLEQKTRAALDFFSNLVDPITGAAPFFGANDGADVLPLDDCAYDDPRGTVQAGYALLDGVRVLPPGPWDEAAWWLTGRDPAALPLRPREIPERWHAVASGCLQWRSGPARLVLLCPTQFRHRPSQPDMLHADLWWRGRPVTHDSGTYSYNEPGALAGLSAAAAHNLPMLAGVEPLRKVGRFLYFPWPQGTAEWQDGGRRFRASHDAYGSEAAVARTITSPEPGVFEITDTMRLRHPGRVRSHWLLADADWKLDAAGGGVSAPWDGGTFAISWRCANAPASVSLVRAPTGSARGWWSRHYLAVEPAVSLELLFDVEGEWEITTRFAHRGA